MYLHLVVPMKLHVHNQNKYNQTLKNSSRQKCFTDMTAWQYVSSPPFAADS